MLCRSDKLRLLTPRSGIGVAGPSARRTPGLPTLPQALEGRGGRSTPPPSLLLRPCGAAALLGDSRPAAAGGAPPPLVDWRRAVAERAAFAARSCAASSTSACSTSSTSNCKWHTRSHKMRESVHEGSHREAQAALSDARWSSSCSVSQGSCTSALVLFIAECHAKAHLSTAVVPRTRAADY
jgi:hypothetical protein